MLSTADVEQKTFSTALRGYDLDEVDDFLDEIVATIRELTEQLEEARAAAEGAPFPATQAAATPPPLAVEPVEAPVEPPPPETPKPDIDESSIGRALVAAQAAADRLLEEAQSEAGKIVEDAQSEADSWTEQREAKRREAEAEISALASRVAAVRSELAALAGEVSEKLDDMDAVIETADVDGGLVDETVTGGGVTAEEVSADESEHEDETGLDDDESEHDDQDEGTDEESTPDNNSDHLDAILTGVATDLQLGSADDGDESSHEDDDESHEGWAEDDD